MVREHHQKTTFTGYNISYYDHLHVFFFFFFSEGELQEEINRGQPSTTAVSSANSRRIPHCRNCGKPMSLNTARCALSSVIHLDDNKTVGSHPLVNRFLKAAFNNRPSIPRYQSVWDPTRVLTYLKKLPPLGSKP